MDIGGPHDFLTEIHRQGEAFIHTLGERLTRGAAFSSTTVLVRASTTTSSATWARWSATTSTRWTTDPLVLVGLKDITAHVNFTGTAVGRRIPGFEVLGYTNQAHFLIDCGLAPQLDAAGIKARSMASKLVMEHEMGELLKVDRPVSRAWSPGLPLGFVQGDRHAQAVIELS